MYSHIYWNSIFFPSVFYMFVCPLFVHWFLFYTSDFLVNVAKADLTLKDKELNTCLHLASSKVSWRPLCASVLFTVYMCVFMLLDGFLQWKCDGQSCGEEGNVVPNFYSSLCQVLVNWETRMPLMTAETWGRKTKRSDGKPFEILPNNLTGKALNIGSVAKRN